GSISRKLLGPSALVVASQGGAYASKGRLIDVPVTRPICFSYALLSRTRYGSGAKAGELAAVPRVDLQRYLRRKRRALTISRHLLSARARASLASWRVA